MFMGNKSLCEAVIWTVITLEQTVVTLHDGRNSVTAIRGGEGETDPLRSSHIFHHTKRLSISLVIEDKCGRGMSSLVLIVESGRLLLIDLHALWFWTVITTKSWRTWQHGPYATTGKLIYTWTIGKIYVRRNQQTNSDRIYTHATFQIFYDLSIALSTKLLMLETVLPISLWKKILRNSIYYTTIRRKTLLPRTPRRGEKSKIADLDNKMARGIKNES